MFRSFMIVMVVALPAIAFAQRASDTNDAHVAKAILDWAVREVRINRREALKMFADPNGRFFAHDGQIYVFCFDLFTGKLLTGQNPGKDVRAIKDSKGEPWGQRLFDAAQRPEGVTTVLSYQAPRPGGDQVEAEKVTYLERVGELGCGVGYYPRRP